MHPSEAPVDAPLACELIVDQFPEWARLRVDPVPSAGTDNVLFRLGRDMVVRLPRTAVTSLQVEKEQAWLPRLAPHLPLPVPTPLALGQPTPDYPFFWSVYRWLPGENATLDRIDAPHQLGRDLARFLRALRGLDTTGAPRAGAHNFFRGVPLAERDEPTRAALEALDGSIDVARAARAWQQALDAPAWRGPPTWIHGDLQSGNLLAEQGRLSAVIDFGGLGVGDPACDLMVAWNLLPAGPRASFRRALGVDEASWVRGRGWALSMGLIALPYYRETNPVLAGIARHAIDEALADHEQA